MQNKEMQKKDTRICRVEFGNWKKTDYGKENRNTGMLESRKVMEEAAAIICAGGLVAFPTETVYGLGGNALDENAAAKIYAAKGRPSDNPLIAHIADFEDLDRIAANVSEKARKCMDAFWPGPLTMIFDKKDIVPYATTGGLDTVAVRMPAHEVALALIRAAKVPIAAPSANLSGRPSPTSAAHVAEDLSGRIDMILDGGSCDIGVESTILDMTVDPPMILRPGFITAESFEEVIGEVSIDPTILDASKLNTQRPKAPGMRYRHYAPKAEMTLVENDNGRVCDAIAALVQQALAEGKKPGVIGTDENCDVYRAISKDLCVKSIGSRNDPEAIAHNLYRVLREFDGEECGVDCIFSESFPTNHLGQAIMNRLGKAAGHHFLLASEIM